MKIPVLSGLLKPRASPKNRLYGSTYSFFFGGTTSGKTVNERTAMQTTAVYACVRILAETIASLPLNVYRSTDNGKEKAIDHQLHYLLHDEPNPEMTSFVFRETLMSHLLLWGNAYAQIIRDGRGRVLALYPLLPDRMTVDRTPEGKLYYEYRKDSGYVILRPEDVLHIPGLGFDGLVGYSPIAMAKNAIGMAIATEEYGGKFFANGASPGGVLEHPGVVKDPARIRESWNAVYQGSGNAHRVAVLEEGMKFQPIGIPPEQAQFLETRKFQTEEICRIFRVPPHLVANLDKATFSNIEHQSISFVVHTIRPWLVRLEQGMNKALLSPSEKGQYFAGFVVEGLLRGDYASRMQGYAIGIQNGFLSPNDVRTLENMNTIEHGNVYAMNGNMLKLEDVGAYANTNRKEVIK
ncbi:Bacteriophage/Gene transfer agent portal protein [Syntrophomonas zehnderi OL-4]|uniref:Bacteriophage/Gene transfer agent portal protein n=1 Tax=Syntrophomonas zehnderi OL-4 TaxID=690567 RepID=A0A0E4C7U1_9FIRM|nr:phage portal protein [Syntrophomonas zehnderi]CFX13978.1 Bacteriophage/Gene transfer agent portal protein [Syntrophomonas zehnderi OL-4]